MTHIAFILTQPSSAWVHMHGALAALRDQGYRVSLIASPGNEGPAVAKREQISWYPVAMERDVAPLSDLRSLLHLTRCLSKIAPDIVIASTPKAGFLGMLAAFLTHIPVRVYLTQGLRLETAPQPLRSVLWLTERLTLAAAHHTLAISPSLVQRYVDLHLARPGALRLIGQGSAFGVDLDRYATPGETAVEGLPDDARFLAFIGRATRDKGTHELFEAFQMLDDPTLHLVIVGELESEDPVPPDALEAMVRHPRVHFTGFVDEVAPYLQRCEMLVLPSHREGFGQVVLEAAAVRKPTVAYRVTGLVDAVVDGVTGTLVEAGDVQALAHAIQRYLDHPELARTHGEAARERVERDFRKEDRQAQWLALLDELMDDAARR